MKRASGIVMKEFLSRRRSPFVLGVDSIFLGLTFFVSLSQMIQEALSSKCSPS